jgi:hypothetical protein
MDVKTNFILDGFISLPFPPLIHMYRCHQFYMYSFSIFAPQKNQFNVDQPINITSIQYVAPPLSGHTMC